MLSAAVRAFNLRITPFSLKAVGSPCGRGSKPKLDAVELVHRAGREVELLDTRLIAFKADRDIDVAHRVVAGIEHAAEEDCFGDHEEGAWVALDFVYPIEGRGENIVSAPLRNLQSLYAWLGLRERVQL
jgi:hypothetical protein